MHRALRLTPLLLVLALASLSGCSGGRTQPAASRSAVAAPGLGIVLATVPAGLEVQSAAKDRIVLVPGDPKLGGAIEITTGSAEAGLNLQEAVKLHRREIEGKPGGRYLGATELSGPTGTAYWSRGRFEQDGHEMEETRIVTLDPSQQRILRLSYVYPAHDDSAKRVNTLLEVLGEIEAPAAKGAS